MEAASAVAITTRSLSSSASALASSAAHRVTTTRTLPASTSIVAGSTAPSRATARRSRNSAASKVSTSPATVTAKRIPYCSYRAPGLSGGSGGGGDGGIGGGAGGDVGGSDGIGGRQQQS